MGSPIFFGGGCGGICEFVLDLCKRRNADLTLISCDRDSNLNIGQHARGQCLVKIKYWAIRHPTLCIER